MNYIATLVLGFCLGAAWFNFIAIHNYRAGMAADFQTRYDYWLADCKAQKWPHEPPIRPTCEEMTKLFIESKEAQS